MVKQNSEGIIYIAENELLNMIVYTDRNGVFNKVNISPEILDNIKATIKQINNILDGKLNIVSNESEDDRAKVLDADKNNGILFDEENYKLSTQSAAKFILEKLKSTKCYFVGGDLVGNDINKMGLETVNISDELIKDYPELLEGDIPILFGRPLFAISSRFNNEEEIEKNIGGDIAFQNVKFLLEKFSSKVVFCHTKQNCDRENKNGKYREINLGYYFENLVREYGLEIGKDIFDLGKGRYSNGEFFDMALGIQSQEEYEKVLGIGDMFTDIEHTLKKGGTGILVSSGDEVVNTTIIEKISSYKDRVFLISDLSKIKVV